MYANYSESSEEKSSDWITGSGSATICSESRALDSELETDWVKVIFESNISPTRNAPRYQVLLSKKSVVCFTPPNC